MVLPPSAAMVPIFNLMLIAPPIKEMLSLSEGAGPSCFMILRSDVAR
jgi:hypothetical protein